MKPKIRVELSDKANRKLLEDFLAEKYELSREEFDLLIVDETTLKIGKERIKRLKEGVFLPVLLVARGRVAEESWELIDEVIKVPVEKKELLKRIEALLKARMQALELKKHAEMLELELASLFEAIGNPILVISPDFEILYANRRTAEIFSAFGISDFIGKKCYSLFHGTDRPIDVCPALKAIKSGKVETKEMEIPVLGGTFVVTTTPIFKNGELFKIVHIAVDVSPLKEVEKEIRSLLFRISRLNELLGVIYRINRQMVRRSRFEEVISDVVHELKALGESFFTTEKERSCVKRALESNEIIREHSEDCKFYAEHANKEVVAVPIEVNSEVGVLLLISESLSESEFELVKTLIEDVKFVKEKLRLEEEKTRLLEQLNKNIEEFAFLVDRIRNPLAVISAYAELFAEESLRNKIIEQVLRIDEIISRLDMLWFDSEKLRGKIEPTKRE